MFINNTSFPSMPLHTRASHKALWLNDKRRANRSKIRFYLSKFDAEGWQFNKASSHGTQITTQLHKFSQGFINEGEVLDILVVSWLVKLFNFQQASHGQAKGWCCSGHISPLFPKTTITDWESNSSQGRLDNVKEGLTSPVANYSFGSPGNLSGVLL